MHTVHDPVKIDDHKRGQVDISFTGIGRFKVPDEAELIALFYSDKRRRPAFRITETEQPFRTAPSFTQENFLMRVARIGGIFRL